MNHIISFIHDMTITWEGVNMTEINGMKL